MTARAPPTFSKVAERYARAVVAGQVDACEWVRLACKRHLDDLVASRRRGFAFRYDPARGERVCKFVQTLHHTKGRWAAAGERVKLEPWQVFLTCAVFGWVRKRDGLRRFRRVFLLIPRKNGKSILAAAWGLYMLVADGEHGAEVYSGATTEKQAWEVFRPARLMALKNPQLQGFYGLEVNAQNLHVYSNASRFEPIIGNPGDGSSPSCAIHDEYHQHDDDRQVDAMLTGMGARDQPLQVIVSTAGDNLAGPCYSAQIEAQQVLQGVVPNDELFACIWGIDQDDDWTDIKVWRKANPNFGISVGEDFLLARLAEAKSNARKQGVNKTKHLNVWVASRQAFFNVLNWQRLAVPGLELADFRGRECMIAVDLSSKVDMTAVTLLFKHDTTPPRYSLFARYYIPEATATAPELEHYHAWDLQNRLIITDGDIIDYGQIRDDIKDLCGYFTVLKLGFDPWQATQMVTELQNDGLPVMLYDANTRNFSEPMKELDALILAGLVEHDGDPVTTWMLSNVTAKPDARDNVYPRKERAENKIDGAVTAIMALGMFLSEEGPTRSVYEDRGVLEVEA